MIRVEPVAGLLLRLYVADSTDPRARYSAVCVVALSWIGMAFLLLGLPLRWARPPEIKGMSGRFHKRYVAEIGQCLSEIGIPTVVASRAAGHVLPGATLIGEFWRWNTAAAAARHIRATPAKAQE